MPCNSRTKGSSSHVLLRTIRPACLGLAKILTLGISAVTAAPTPLRARDAPHEIPEAEGSALWILYVVSIILVLLGGAFAGLTIALMGQDSIYLQVIARDPEEPQRRNAKRVYDLLGKGKHWVLVTLLLGNVIVNETLPVVLDRCFGGGVAAVVGSTVLIVIFGEILPQSVCVRYGLQIGGYMSTPVLLLMYAMAPVAWPTAKLLDWLLGEDHGTVYKKSGLKTLVTLHKSLGEVSERLNQDEVTIISAVLDLKRKPVEEVMTPMEDVYILSEDTVLDQETIDKILDAGYSRIPIHQTGKPFNFVGMLLVKILITYDPEDAKKVSDFALATLPETRPETSCLDIINFFQEGKSHMVLVSEYPGEDHGALGVVTLEDVIEELIGEEIIDESDVFVDIHKAIRRAHPAPKARYHKLIDIAETEEGARVATSLSNRSQSVATGRSGSPAILPAGHGMSLLKRRSSADQNGQIVYTTVPVRANYDEIRDHLRHLGPSNPASNPRATKVSSIKIKDAAHPRHSSLVSDILPEGRVPTSLIDGADERTSLLSPKVTGKDGIQALARHQSYTTPTSRSPIADQDVEVLQPLLVIETDDEPAKTTDQGVQAAAEPAGNDSPTAVSTTESVKSGDSQLTGGLTARPRTARGHVRSGSITENVIEAGGVRKVVLEASISTSDEEDPEHTSSHGRSRSRSTLGVPGRATSEEGASTSEGKSTADGASNNGSANGRGGGKKKTRRKKRKGGK